MEGWVTKYIPKISSAVVLAAALSTPAAGQSTPVDKRGVAETSRERVGGGAENGVLSDAERRQVRTAFEREKVDPFTLGETVRPDDTAVAERQVVIGRPFPRALPVRPVPERLGAKLPSKTGYEYRLFGDDIALVDTGTGNVADILREVYAREDKR